MSGPLREPSAGRPVNPPVILLVSLVGAVESVLNGPQVGREHPSGIALWLMHLAACRESPVPRAGTFGQEPSKSSCSTQARAGEGILG